MDSRLNNRDYHIQELSIANDPYDARRVMPPVTGCQRILDVGCGAGQTLIASNLPLGVLGVGVDVDHSALSLGRQLTEAIRFVVAKGESLPFGDECFDLVICRVALPYMHIESALGEMSRVLRAGGRLWIVLHPFSLTLSELASNMVRFNVKGALYRLWVLTNGLTLHGLGRQWPWFFKPGHYESWQTSGGVTRALRTAGFGRIQISRGKHFVVTAIRNSVQLSDFPHVLPLS